MLDIGNDSNDNDDYIIKDLYYIIVYINIFILVSVLHFDFLICFCYVVYNDHVVIAFFVWDDVIVDSETMKEGVCVYAHKKRIKDE